MRLAKWALALLLLSITGVWSQQAVAQKPDKDGIYPVHGEVVPPKLIHPVPVIYSEQMRQLNAQGTCLLYVAVGADGIPTTSTVLMPLNEPFDKATIEAANQMRFEPATLHRNPIPVKLWVEASYITNDLNAQLPKAIHYENPITPPLPLNTVAADYSKKSRKAKVQGIVVVSLIVTADGLPTDIQIKQHLADDLDQSALNAASKYRFRPATLDGRPVPI
jgi:TonB family protein